MTSETKHESTTGHGSFERQDLQASGVLYFLLGLAVAVLLCILGLRGLFVFLDHREKAAQPAVDPLVTNVPTDTRRISNPDEYLKKAFPDPRLETDERNQLNKETVREEGLLYSYGWVDEKAGTVHIPIERALDLIVQRGLPVRPQGGASAAAALAVSKDEKK
ncbi:MAG: hypothetical protein WB799_17200 [Candidatus Sulfotelmatobacter sp.]